MTLNEFLKDVAIPVLALAYTGLKVLKDLRSAKTLEAKRALAAQETIDKLLVEKDEQWQQQVDFLQDQLDKCLDGTRPKRPGA